MIQGEHVPRYDITMKQGADYLLTIQFQPDDDSEIEDYGVMIQGEILYVVDGSDYEDSDENMLCSEHWDIDVPDERIFVTGKWNIEAHLREFAEAADHFAFTVSMAGDGFSLSMPHETTKLITYSRGVYDVFLNENDGTRTKILMGQARILREVTR